MVDLNKVVANAHQRRAYILQQVGEIELDIAKYKAGTITLEDLEAKYKDAINQQETQT